MNGKKRIVYWLPLCISVLCAAATLAVYTAINESRAPLVYLQISAASLIPAILPVTSLIIKKEFPPFLNFLVTLHVILAMDLGNAMSFYWRFDFWDVMMHTYFGFLASIVLYVVFLMAGGDRMSKAMLLVAVFLSVMGCGALWEVFEYVTDALLAKDAQQVWASLNAGKNPVYDTMMDVIVTAVGSAVFYLILLIDKLSGRKLHRRLLGKFIG